MSTTTPGGLFVAHADHGLTDIHLSVIDTVLKDWDGKTFFLKLVTLPIYADSLPSALWGPDAGDDPIPNDHPDVVWRVRGNRAQPSKLVKRPVRQVRKMVVCAGPGKHGDGIVYSAYGSQCLGHREPWDRSMNDEERAAAEAWWAQHALSVDV